MKSYVLGASAQSDLDEIWEYIAEDNIDAADEWIARLFAAFETLAQRPGLGHSREDLTDLPALFWPMGSYLILYRRRRDRIEIIGITQGAHDIPAFLHQRNP